MEPTLSGPKSDESSRTTLKRSPDRAVFDRIQINEVLDSNTLAYVGVADQGQPYVLPMAYARDGDRLLLHGSRASRLMKLLAQAAPCCATVVSFDAIVVARSGYESSMNYRSVLVLGRCREITADEVGPALEAVIDGLLPGRSSEVRRSTPKELAATMFVELPLTECSMKSRTGSAEEPDQDHDLSIWGGIVPVVTSFGQPQADEWALAKGLPVPKSVLRLLG